MTSTASPTGKKVKQFTAHFYCFNDGGNKVSTRLTEFLQNCQGSHGQALHLEEGSAEFFQIRSVLVNNKGNVFQAVFGRCRKGETPEQAAETGDEKDVKLEDGYGLVEKNHFIFFSDLNLVVYQQNNNGSKYQRLQRYLAKVLKSPQVALEPVLTRDSYKRLIEGGKLHKIELSILEPKLIDEQSEVFIQEAISVFQTSNAKRLKITLTADRNGSLAETMKQPFLTLARFGRAKVARVTLNGSDEDEIIDFVADRIKQPIHVQLQPNGRARASDIYAALAHAKDERKDDLRAFFGN